MVCGEHVHCGEPTTRGSSRYLGMDTPFHGYRLSGPGQTVSDHIEASRNVSDPTLALSVATITCWTWGTGVQ